MDDRTYRILRNIAIVFTVLWLGWEAYDSLLREAPGDDAYLAGNTLFEDGHYERALDSYRAALDEKPDHIHALRGLARSLMMLGRNDEALAVFDEAIARAPEVAATYANRGILNDRMGRYAQAMADYETALRLDPEIAEGPNWLTRFMRNQPEKPPSVADRLGYLRAQMALPESERVLRVPEIDQAQRPYEK
ncbi:MAG: tetratricopeptide repeat protein [Alphaproteobacteria bacterium]